MVNEPIGVRRPAVIDGLLQCIQYKVCRHATGGLRADDTLDIGLDHEAHIPPSLPSGYIGAVRHPQAIRVIVDEVALDQSPWAGRCAIWHRSTHPFATPDALDTKATHQ